MAAVSSWHFCLVMITGSTGASPIVAGASVAALESSFTTSPPRGLVPVERRSQPEKIHQKITRHDGARPRRTMIKIHGHGPCRCPNDISETYDPGGRGWNEVKPRSVDKEYSGERILIHIRTNRGFLRFAQSHPAHAATNLGLRLVVFRESCPSDKIVFRDFKDATVTSPHAVRWSE